MAIMNELVDQVIARTGLPRDKAESAARVAVDFIDERLPEPIGGRIKPLLEGKGGEGAGGAGEALGGLGDKLGL
ncbi:MAG: hypothetical protein ACRELX_13485 [Longimicrobiales bacterium]